jgi:DHA1 family bicyclomycin/chloramphenicol resistance-like MFS transporter
VRETQPVTTGQRARLVLALGSLVALGPLTIDLYLPALPAIATDLTASSAAVQLTLTGTLIGMAGGQLLIGPLSDAWGRRAPLVAGIAVHVLASVLCVFAPSITALGGLRVLQGVGVAASSVVAMAMVRDMFEGAAFARIFSRLMLVMGAAPILAPTLGSAVLRWTDWRGVFVVLAVAGVLLIVVAGVGLPETLPPHRRRPGGLAGSGRVYANLLRDRSFIGLVLVAGSAMAALFAYISGSSFVFQDRYGLSEQQFGLVFGAGALGLIAATQLNVVLLRRAEPAQILGSALMVGTAAGAVLVVFAATGFAGLAGVVVPLWVVLAAAGLALPNAPALALSRHGETAGTASALLGSVQFGVGALAAPLVGVLGTGPLAMAVVVAGGMAVATATLWFVVRPAVRAEPRGAAVAAVAV